jgi:SPX domain protein involved in polyphosphate accumulation
MTEDNMAETEAEIKVRRAMHPVVRHTYERASFWE